MTTSSRFTHDEPADDSDAMGVLFSATVYDHKRRMSVAVVYGHTKGDCLSNCEIITAALDQERL